MKKCLILLLLLATVATTTLAQLVLTRRQAIGEAAKRCRVYGSNTLNGVSIFNVLLVSPVTNGIPQEYIKWWSEPPILSITTNFTSVIVVRSNAVEVLSLDNTNNYIAHP